MNVSFFFQQLLSEVMAEHQMEDTPNELEPESSNQHNSNVAMEDPVSLESGFQILPSDSGISNNSECELNKDNSFTQTSHVDIVCYLQDGSSQTPVNWMSRKVQTLPTEKSRCELILVYTNFLQLSFSFINTFECQFWLQDSRNWFQLKCLWL